VIGKVTDDGLFRATMDGREEVNLPIETVVKGALKCERPTRRPDYLDEVETLKLNELKEPELGDDVLKQLLASPTIASKRWVYEQYDHMVRLNTLVMPGSDAAVLRIRDTEKALAIAVDCNSRYCYLDPYRGAEIAVAECCRNLSCSGAEPIGVTNCLNFGNPENPEIMWQFEQAVQGLGDMCRYLDIPIVSGNVSLYNETKGVAIFPTPTVAVVGLMEDRSKHCTQWFKEPGHSIGMLGIILEELGGSEYIKQQTGETRGQPPVLDHKLEKSLQRLVRELIRIGAIASAHDCSEGGLAVALVESCITGPVSLGAEIQLKSNLRTDALLFGESQSRVVVSFPNKSRETIQQLAAEAGVPWSVIGNVQGDRFRVRIKEETYIDQEISVLDDLWKNSLSHYANRTSQ